MSVEGRGTCSLPVPVCSLRVSKVVSLRTIWRIISNSHLRRRNFSDLFSQMGKAGNVVFAAPLPAQLCYSTGRVHGALGARQIHFLPHGKGLAPFMLVQ